MKQRLTYKTRNQLSYAEYGDPNGFPILVQHGLIASIDDNELFDRLIQAGSRLICAGRPGYGESSPYLLHNFAEWADITAALIQELQLSQFDLLGMSSGAPYSYAIGSQLPKMVRNIYIYSGIPALYDEKVRTHWPYPVIQTRSMSELQNLARELFFSAVSLEDTKQIDVSDSMMNDCFGVAQDLRLRFMDWGFHLSDVKANVTMQHSRDDENVPLITAEITAGLLERCRLVVKENGGHFSSEALDAFIETEMMRQSLE
jgi:pimeloyl-ACP methyl ester carboxylesterase